MFEIFNEFCQFRAVCDGEYDCRENCYMRFFKNVSSNEFENYVNTLTDDGNNILQKNDLNGNRFVSLGGKIQINILYTPCECEMRVTASKKDMTPCYEKKEFKNEFQTTFYGFESDQTLIDCGMCLLVQCCDGSFFVVDSGHYFQMNDNDRIYKFMRERTPSGQKVVVSGWFITHAHTDHISKLIDFLKYNTDDVIIEGFYQNLIRSDYKTDSDNHEENEMAEKLFGILEKFDAPVYKLHTGMKFFVRNLEFEVLSTHEDIYPDWVEDYNDSSTVLMMTVDGSKVFIPGDAAVKQSAKLETRFGSWLKCDVVQVAHHGHTGLTKKCYEYLGAKVAVFPVTRIFYEEDLKKHEANAYLYKTAQNFVTGDGTVAIPLPYNGTVTKFPDETFEDFEKIKRLWRYVYSEERKNELYEQFLKNGGSEENLLLPTSRFGWIEPKPPVDE